MGETNLDITHMLFVNDAMLFAEVSTSNIQNVLTIVDSSVKGWVRELMWRNP